MTRAEFERSLSALVEANRVEQTGGRIRASYGHSLSVIHRAAVPPSRLFHGTGIEHAASLFRVGLSPRGRRHVHLTTELLYAQRVSLRYGTAPLILQVDASAAHRAGVQFFAATPTVWLSSEIPPQFLTRFAASPPGAREQRAAIRALFAGREAPLHPAACPAALSVGVEPQCHG